MNKLRLKSYAEVFRGLGLLLILCLPACALTQQPRQGDNVIHLFDGNSLAGWRQLGEASWRLVDNHIEATGEGDGFLVSEKQYGNFRLTLAFWVDARVNSGVFIGCSDGSRIDPEVCYEINIWDNHPRPSARTGAIVFHVMPPLVHAHTIGKWNTYEIISVDSRVTVKLNGVLTADLDNARTEPGHIALQHAGYGTVRFRSLRLYPLVKESAATEAAVVAADDIDIF